MNSKYITQVAFADLWPDLQTWMEQNQFALSEFEKENFKLLVSLLQTRSATIQELKEALEVYFRDPKNYAEKGVDKYFKDGTSVALFSLFAQEIKNWPDSVFRSIETIEKHIRQFAEKQNTGAGKVIHPLRLALTGKTESPGIFELVSIFGKQKVLNRIEKALEFIKKLDE